jgi:hypothetical protein
MKVRMIVVSHIIDNHASMYMGMSYKEWVHHSLGWSPEEYAEHMLRRQVHGLDDKTWGGALEAGVLAKLHRCHLHLFDRVQGGYQRMNEAILVGGESTCTDLKQGRQVCLVWSGVHYNTLILR